MLLNVFVSYVWMFLLCCNVVGVCGVLLFVLSVIRVVGAAHL